MANDALDFPYGYAVRRNGSCSSGEVDCGSTWNNQHACCPGSTFCPLSSKTSVCCPSKDDCTNSLVGPNTHCGDSTASLFYVTSSRNFFCCSNDTSGYAVTGYGYVGCANDISDVPYDVKPVTVVSSASASSAITSITATPTDASSPKTTTDLPTPNTSPTATEKSVANTSAHTNTGAIAGGVVGGVVGAAILLVLVWFLLRRRKKSPPNEKKETQIDDASQQLAQAHFF
ncbi:hypothetical protein N7450_003952 [Penicillium hetheringtonii]|uniref:Epidermal growth factor receptor-like transmembrane-juxtamembrane segment domain-containing protein n=1 Tax=Penicillium hetheringtonii TaxID=911720 RepID=A0AAD6GVA4_9EURO|nr:hypothetical protein N7450_003952 [Penicillium hetheringtonii]